MMAIDVNGRGRAGTMSIRRGLAIGVGVSLSVFMPGTVEAGCDNAVNERGCASAQSRKRQGLQARRIGGMRCLAIATPATTTDATTASPDNTMLSRWKAPIAIATNAHSAPAT